jgi:hypothetical protein
VIGALVLIPVLSLFLLRNVHQEAEAAAEKATLAGIGFAECQIAS